MLFFCHLRSQLVHKLLPGGAPMASGGDEQSDLGLGIALADGFQVPDL